MFKHLIAIAIISVVMFLAMLTISNPVGPLALHYSAVLLGTFIAYASGIKHVRHRRYLAAMKQSARLDDAIRFANARDITNEV